MPPSSSGEDLSLSPATVTSVLAATESVFAAVDILDSRYAEFQFTLPDVIADNASAGLFLVGPTAPAGHPRPDAHRRHAHLLRRPHRADSAGR
jgi:2-keto-4-pentenoate hydratase